MSRHAIAILFSTLYLSGCAGPPPQAAEPNFEMTAVAKFNQPWAMAFLPDGRLLVTEKPGVLKLHDIARNRSIVVAGVPEVVYMSQGGLGDVVLHPRFADNQLLYLSYAEEGDGGLAGAAVARARLEVDGERAALRDLQVIWRQVPKTDGRGHYGHRIAFSPDGYLFVSSGEKELFDPAQDMQSTLGKIVRLNDDGTIPADNPFAGRNDALPEIWSLGHRNPLGLAFDADGQLWNTEMGPRGGDELNRVVRGANYGYPIVSEGSHYSGLPIPDHDTRPEFAAPAVSWNPVISPANLLFYSGAEFPAWQGSALIGGLAGVLVRVEFSADGSAREAERFAIWQGVRALAQGPDGTVWFLENTGEGAALVQLTAK